VATAILWNRDSVGTGVAAYLRGLSLVTKNIRHEKSAKKGGWGRTSAAVDGSLCLTGGMKFERIRKLEKKTRGSKDINEKNRYDQKVTKYIYTRFPV